MNNKIIARNLTAQAAYDVPGNPPSTRLESSVGNCYPGLEYDHRNLDRRFFPGLVFEFVSQGDANSPSVSRQGALLRSVETRDAALASPPAGLESAAGALSDQLGGDDGAKLSVDGMRWYISTIAQGGVKLGLDGDAAAKTPPLDGLTVWRLVRSLRPGPITLELKRRDAADVVTLSGWRRRYTDAVSGVIDAAFQPGELTQSLCSPWMHDFRDCGCTYWASNHPDIVLGEAPTDEPTLPSGAPDAVRRGAAQIDWLRADRDWFATSAVGEPGRRDRQMSYFEINQRWQDLAIVLEGREIGDFYVPRSRQLDNAAPYANATELRDQLFALAGLEHLVSLMYLYARYSVVTPEDAAAPPDAATRPLLGEDLAFTRHILLEIAVSEMQHLRWVNQILWGLFESGLVPGWTTFEPQTLHPSRVIPGAGGLPETPAKFSPLTPETLKLFVAIEEPSGFIDGRYSRATATLLQPDYPGHLHDLASAIVRDGEQHYLHFRDMMQVLRAYPESVYLRRLVEGAPTDPEVSAAIAVYKTIVEDLYGGYQRGNPMNMKSLAEARAKMFDLDAKAAALAQKNIGVPFLAAFGQA